MNLFPVGELVQCVDQPEMVGLVKEVRWNEQDQGWVYRIEFGDATYRPLPETVLVKFAKMPSRWESHLTGDPEEPFEISEELSLTRTQVSAEVKENTIWAGRPSAPRARRVFGCSGDHAYYSPAQNPPA